jgi:hypothetical protein
MSMAFGLEIAKFACHLLEDKESAVASFQLVAALIIIKKVSFRENEKALFLY